MELYGAFYQGGTKGKTGWTYIKTKEAPHQQRSEALDLRPECGGRYLDLSNQQEGDHEGIDYKGLNQSQTKNHWSEHLVA